MGISLDRFLYFCLRTHPAPSGVELIFRGWNIAVIQLCGEAEGCDVDMGEERQGEGGLNSCTMFGLCTNKSVSVQHCMESKPNILSTWGGNQFIVHCDFL